MKNANLILVQKVENDIFSLYNIHDVIKCSICYNLKKTFKHQHKIYTFDQYIRKKKKNLIKKNASSI